MDYYTLAEQLMELHVALHIIPINQELAALERGMFFALNFLMFHKHSAYPKELSRGMGVSSARVAALLNHLEKEGLIQRRPDPKDNRQVIVSLTENGIHAIRQKRWDKRPARMDGPFPYQPIKRRPTTRRHAGAGIRSALWDPGLAGMPCPFTIMRLSERLTIKSQPLKRVAVKNEMVQKGYSKAEGQPALRWL